MQIKSNIKYNRSSAKKLRFMTSAIKAMKPQDAQDRLFVMQTRGAKHLYKAIKSAITAAKLSQLDMTTLIFKELIIEEGPSLKRFSAGSRGMAKPFVRQTAHIRVILEGSEIINKEIKSQVKKK